MPETAYEDTAHESTAHGSSVGVIGLAPYAVSDGVPRFGKAEGRAGAAFRRAPANQGGERPA